MALDKLAESLGARPAFTRRQSNALIAPAVWADKPLLLAKPQQYMNLSGGPVGSLVKFYRVPLENLLVCYDELDLPVGSLRLRPEGSAAGHNGMRSILQSLGTSAVPRMRIGIGRPSAGKPGANYVLSDFRGEDAEQIQAALARAVDAVKMFVEQGIVAAMNRHNSA